MQNPVDFDPSVSSHCYLAANIGLLSPVGHNMTLVHDPVYRCMQC